MEIAKQLKEQSGPKLKDFRALLEKGVPQPIEDLKMEVFPSIPLAQIRCNLMFMSAPASC